MEKIDYTEEKKLISIPLASEVVEVFGRQVDVEVVGESEIDPSTKESIDNIVKRSEELCREGILDKV